MNIRYAFWKGVDKLKQRFQKAPKKELPPKEHHTVKAPEPVEIPMMGKKRSGLSPTSGAARRRARAVKAKRQVKKSRNKQQRKRR